MGKTPQGECATLDRMTKTVAFANQKGGVGKTTSTINVAHALAAKGKRVLLVDADPQASLTQVAGLEPRHVIELDASGSTLYHVLLKKTAIQQAIVRVGEIDLIPASIRLARIDQELHSFHGVSNVLRSLLAPVLPNYDVVLIDCLPSLTLLGVNALTAADAVVIPCKTDPLSAAGISYLFETIEDTRAHSNPRLKVLGILPTMFDSRILQAQETVDFLQLLAKPAGIEVFPPIPATTKHNTANGMRSSVVREYPDTPGAERYNQLADTIIAYGTN